MCLTEKVYGVGCTSKTKSLFFGKIKTYDNMRIITTSILIFACFVSWGQNENILKIIAFLFGKCRNKLYIYINKLKQ